MTGETASGASQDSPEQGDSVSEASSTPFLQVITPSTTPEEVAAIVAVLASLGGGEPAPEPPRSEWANPARGLRTPPGVFPAHGRGAWRASAFPR